MVAESELSDFTEVWSAAIDKKPGTEVKDTEASPETPAAVAVIVASPEAEALVRVTNARPDVVVELDAERVPISVEKVTDVPSAMLAPLESSTLAEIEVWDEPSATILSEPTLTATEPTVVPPVVVVVVVVSSSLKQNVRVRLKAIIRRASSDFMGKALFVVFISSISLI